MAIYNLPRDFFLDAESTKHKIIFYKYSPQTTSVKVKSILHTNLISLLMHGEKKIYYANEILTVTEKHFLISSGGNSITSEKLSNQNKFISILIFFDNSILHAFRTKYANMILKNKLDNAKKSSALVLHKDDFIINYIHSLNLIIEKQITCTEEMKQLKLEELFLYILQTEPKSFLSFEPLTTSQETDMKIQKTIEAHITSNISIEELAFMCNMSLSTFKRKFLQLHQTSPTKWILEKRMELAKELLKQPGQKPSDIYYQLGYENHSSFTEIFKQLVGITPKQYQLQN